MLEGSRAISLTVANIGPQVVSAYPITPQTHIVEDLAKLKSKGRAGFAYLRAESEFAAASIVLGASAAGLRAYSATSSQGLLLMAEVLFNISGLRLPLVMTCANRAVSAPINIWNDHSDAMAVRDSGWIQLFASDNQEAVYFHILAYKIAEKLRLPVLVNVDGFILTHAYSPVNIPSRAQIAKYLPPYRPKPDEYLNPARPRTFGGFFSPDYYMETREQLHDDLNKAAGEISKEYLKLGRHFKFAPQGNGLLEYVGPKRPKTILVAMGSVTGTIEASLPSGSRVGLLKIKAFRPFPQEAVRLILSGAKRVAVIEKAVSPGQSGPLFSEIKASLGRKSPIINDYIVGLGGRDVTLEMLRKIIEDSRAGDGKLEFIGKI